MRDIMRRLFSVNHADRKARHIFGLILLVAALYVAACVGMAYVAGFGAVQHRLATAQWWWLGPAFAALVLGFWGYYLAYKGIAAPRGARRSRALRCWRW